MTKKDYEVALDTMFKGIHSLVEGVNSKLDEIKILLNKSVAKLPKSLPLKESKPKTKTASSKQAKKAKTPTKKPVKVKETVTITKGKPSKMSKKLS